MLWAEGVCWNELLIPIIGFQRPYLVIGPLAHRFERDEWWEWLCRENSCMIFSVWSHLLAKVLPLPQPITDITVYLPPSWHYYHPSPSQARQKTPRPLSVHHSPFSDDVEQPKWKILQPLIKIATVHAVKSMLHRTRLPTAFDREASAIPGR